MNHRIPSSFAATLSTFALATVVVAGCGQAFSLTGGTSGSGSGGNGGEGSTTSSTTASASGSGTTTSSSSASSSSSTSTGSGMPGCNWGPGTANLCGPNEYCDDLSCGKTMGAGKCKSRVSNKTGDVPVCGCDKLTYWNGAMAAAHGVPTPSQDVCPHPGDVPCNEGNPCPGGGGNLFCRKYDKGCNVVFQGACWMVPADCSTTAAKVETCVPKNCVNECDAIRQGNVFDQDCTGG